MLTALFIALTAPDFPPIDEGANNVQFAEFRRNMIGSIEKKKYDWAIARIALDIDFSFGFEPDKRELLKSWELNPGDKEKFFAELLKCLKMGGQFKKYDEHKYFVAPYVFSAWPNDLDPFEYIAVTTVTANVYENPDPSSKVIDEAHQTIVKTDLSNATDEWHFVEYQPEKWGWIMMKDLRSPIDYRAHFLLNHKDSYVLKVFLAGD